MSSTSTTSRGTIRAFLSAIRPGQWVKNGLILVAPAASGELTRHDVMRHTAVAFVAYCLLASSLYLVNDLRDIDADRRHPTKSRRAIASGDLSPALAWVAAVVMAAVAFVLPMFLFQPAGLEFILALYAVITLTYSFGLKHVAVIELAMVASGFFLRAYAGAVASHIFVSSWFLVVISFGALFLAVGKRSSELKNIGVNGTRKVLHDYTTEFLDSALTLSATVTVAGYCLWAFDTSRTGLSSIHHHIVPIRLSVAPVVLAILFIMKSAEAGGGAAPEELILKNRTVQALLVIWGLLLAIGIYR
jgi:decaprenyl-phosphate phosphoribosyltransferase